MLNIIKEAMRKREGQRLLLEFHDEVCRNWEAYYVMFQLGKLRAFELAVWKKIKSDAHLPIDGRIRTSLEILEDYNIAFDDFKKYEQWYSADIDRKTRENSLVLHEKREAANAKFQPLEAVVKTAREVLEQQLHAQKILKN